MAASALAFGAHVHCGPVLVRKRATAKGVLKWKSRVLAVCVGSRAWRDAALARLRAGKRGL